MFQDTLLIIKCDYLHKRRALLIYLLKHGFQIQGQRRILFSPELAAEFYQDMADEPCFMFQVILLSKGPSEAFILAKEYAVEHLLNSLLCYFGNSVEMEQNLHVTRCLGKVRKEICFIFPNYIFEPIYCPEQMKFCSNNSLMASLTSEVYDIVTTPERDPQKSWKEKLAERLILSNKNLPHVSNQCSRQPALNVREIAQQTKVTAFKHEHGGLNLDAKSSMLSEIIFDTDGISLNSSSSSCVTCSAFGSGEKCADQAMVDLIKGKTAPLSISGASTRTDEMKENDEQGEWMDEQIEAEVDYADIEIHNDIAVVEVNILDHRQGIEIIGSVETAETENKSAKVVFSEVEDDDLETQDYIAVKDRNILYDRQGIEFIEPVGSDPGDAATALETENKSAELVFREVENKTDHEPQAEQLEVEVLPQQQTVPDLSEQPDNIPEQVLPQTKDESARIPHFDDELQSNEPSVGE